MPLQLRRKTQGSIAYVTYIFSVAFILCFLFSGCAGTPVQKNTFSMKDVEGLGVIDAIDKIALTDPNYNDPREKEIRAILSKIDDPQSLFEYLVQFDQKIRSVTCDGKCPPYERYERAITITMERLSEIKTDDAAKYLVLILEKKILSGHAHLSEELLHFIAETGHLALPYLKRIEKDNDMAKMAIDCIEKQQPCH